MPLGEVDSGVESDSDSTKQLLPDPIRTAARLQAMPCLYQLQDGRFWQYEFCPRIAIKQFHPLLPNQQPGANDEYYLGVSLCNTFFANRARLP